MILITQTVQVNDLETFTNSTPIVGAETMQTLSGVLTISEPVLLLPGDVIKFRFTFDPPIEVEG